MEGAKDNTPNDLLFDHEVFSLDFSPVQDCIASGLVDGSLFVHHYATDQNTQLLQLQVHSKACRAVLFTDDGTGLYTASSDGSIKEISLNGGKVSWTQSFAHDCGINAMLLFENNIFTGDEEGMVRVWDVRTKKCTNTWERNEDFISDFTINDNILLCASGDGTLSVFDIRKGFLGSSENLEDELLSLVLLKNNSKVVCGTQTGVLQIFSWGNWEAPTDRFPGHPDSVETMYPINENMILTGSSDGLIRVVNLYPNKLLGVVGEHEEFPIERLGVCRNDILLASCSHDSSIKFWNIEMLAKGGEEEETDKERINQVQEKFVKPKEKEINEMKNFFSDL
uniref:Uncharacterized protein n=1 Tax=Arcella intermedia TaxID=1963864 RepID=A0A6B2L9G0_9EUKA|eukprot:TRINITY_DN3861_c0_g1_i1.p1 TRINITY_DN3861_c0_g1~~TRINITY_DN3861_c0_g1_i1.p1  ORF type:complete len:348 (-),score=68.29 TRINITY_DN3861_c0_g1_i1:1009-2022(-)